MISRHLEHLITELTASKQAADAALTLLPDGQSATRDFYERASDVLGGLITDAIHELRHVREEEDAA